MNQQIQQKDSEGRKQDAAAQYFHGGVDNKNGKKKENRNSRKSSSGNIKRIVIAVIAALAIAGVGFMIVSKDVSDLEGEWVRQPDDTNFAGMIVEFKQEDGRYVGVIKYSPVTEFSVGQEKWSDITKAGFNTFYEYDLWDDGITRSHAKLKVSLDGKTLTNAAINQGAMSYGANQIWKKK